ncbi:MAG: DUF5004 domain-containing protein [Saprospiraceae bacterium]|nr:DUF5004 domain-containing protein [Saprospiraceae bacterium]
MTRASVILCLGTLTSCLLMLTSCEDEDINVPAGALEEQPVDLSGQWQVSRAWQNGKDITDLLDFNEILLTLQMNGGPTAFQIKTGSAPFPVLEDGMWSFDDFAYPKSLNLRTNNSQRSIDFTNPPISSSSDFALSFSLGCQDNLYTYEFRKVQ